MIRLAVEMDRVAVEEIVQAAYQPWVEVVGGRPQPMDADYGALIATERVHVIGSGEVEGLIVLIPEDGVLLVENVAVAPEAQGRGVGRRLLAFAEEEARRLRLPALRLFTHSKMARNIALYTSLGYSETHRQPINGGELVHMRTQLSNR